jgi:2-polyprenyl-3-methyl-5-hydroxy-6-metoxy-1,4-benzoquinol methylase
LHSNSIALALSNSLAVIRLLVIRLLFLPLRVCRQPLVSFVYERGWRQNFAGAGFPGAEKEYEMAMQYLKPAEGGVLIDASCGTGLFTRLFARSKKFAGVVALDFSESMLQQAQQFFAQDPALKTR